MSNRKKIDTTIIEKGVRLLQTDNVVAIPTETVYGLAAHIHSDLAVQKIFALKNRPKNHPLIVHCCDLEMARNYAIFSPLALEIAENFWPGPLTLILPKTDKTPDTVTGSKKSVGIRIPQNNLTLEIIKQLQAPIVAPSANQFGKVSPTKAQHVKDDLGEKVFVIDGGDCTIGVESTILDLFQGPSILRPGKISAEEILIFTKTLIASTTVASGTLQDHYQPNTPILLSQAPNILAKDLQNKGYNVGIVPQVSPTVDAQRLYHHLRELDKLNLDYIIAQPSTLTGIGVAINDRLKKAAQKIYDL